jgi:hypothetical protein
MPASQPSEAFRALCYEHHVEMKLKPSFSNGGENTRKTATFACPEADCRVHYSISRGYFLPSENGHRNDLEVVPAVRCLDDGTPMYLAEIDLDKRDYRLWVCPQCGGRRTHEQGLVSMPSRENQDARGEREAETQTPSLQT